MISIGHTTKSNIYLNIFNYISRFRTFDLITNNNFKIAQVMLPNKQHKEIFCSNF